MAFVESEVVELKAEVVGDICKEVIAFANTKGGTLYIGVSNDGSVEGVKNADQVILQLNNMIRDSIKPDVTMFVGYKTQHVGDKDIIAVTIQKGTDRPYYLGSKGLKPSGVYVRNGTSTDPASDTAIRKMIKETDGDHFEEMRSLEQNLTFDVAKKEFAERKVPFGIPQMKTLGIMNHDGIYTNLGLLLSDQCVHTIKAAVFEGTIQNEFKDRREFSGSLFCQMNEAYDYIDFRNQNHSTFSKLRRIDRRDYPEEAVREALLNLLVHREYSFRASSFISIYADRIEFTSIGGLISGMTLQDVMMGISVCRNAKLANVFYRLELIEAYGTGIRKIMEAYEGSARKPKIEVTENAFKITIPNRNISNASDEETEDQKESVEQEKRVMKLAKERGFVSRKEIERLLGISQSTGGRLLKKMVAAGQIVQIGKGKNTHYVLQN